MLAPIVSGRRRLRTTLFFDACYDYSVCLANALAEHVDLTVVSPATWQQTLRADLSPAVRFVPVPQPRLRSPRRALAARAIVRHLFSDDPDVVHLQQSGDPWLHLGLAASRPTSPLVLTVHDVAPHPGDGAQVPGAHHLQRAWQRRVRRFIVHTPGLREHAGSAWGIEPGRIDVVPHGELGSLYGGHRPAQDRAPATVLFYGRRWAYKGLDVLVEALNVLGPAHHDLRLVIAGTGEPVDRYLRLLEERISVEVIDRYVDRETTADLFSEATVVCLPHREASQSGVAALALGFGTPIVASSAGGLGELLRDGTDALVVAPGDAGALADALDRLLLDRGLQERLSIESRRRAQSELAWAAIGERTVEVYRRALAG
jgi:glycosyltransferase involved in cell wall biosynthesis